MTALDLVWYEHQIHLLAKGREPRPGLSPWNVVWSTLTGIGSVAFKNVAPDCSGGK